MPAQPLQSQDPASTRAGLETPWWGATPNITNAPPGARAFVLDAVQAAVGAVRITGTGISASVTTWEGAPCPMAAATNPLEALTSITLNPDRTRAAHTPAGATSPAGVERDRHRPY